MALAGELAQLVAQAVGDVVRTLVAGRTTVGAFQSPCVTPAGREADPWDADKDEEFDDTRSYHIDEREAAPESVTPVGAAAAPVAAAKTTIVEGYCAAKEVVTTTTRTLSTLMPLRRILLVALGVGVVISVLGYVAPAGVAAVLTGIGGVVTAAVAQVGSWFRRSLRGSTANCSS